MYPLERIQQEREIWKSKTQLRLLKANYYSCIEKFLPAQGRVVEIGSGCGGLKEFIPRSIASDIFLTPWVDLVMTAESLPFQAGSLSGLIGVDVLHHMERPLAFFQEAARVLKAGGKLILLDPYVSWGSWVPWHLFHHEKCSMREPFDLSGPFVAENNARATLWFEQRLKLLESLIRPLTLEKTQHLDLFYYPLVGGYRPWSMIPSAVASKALRMDRWLGHRFGKWLGYRMLIVLRRE